MRAVAADRVQTGPQLSAVAKICVGQTSIVMRQFSKFGKHLLARIVVHLQPDAACDFADDLPVLPGLAGYLFIMKTAWP